MTLRCALEGGERNEIPACPSLRPRAGCGRGNTEAPPLRTAAGARGARSVAAPEQANSVEFLELVGEKCRRRLVLSRRALDEPPPRLIACEGLDLSGALVPIGVGYRWIL